MDFRIGWTLPAADEFENLVRTIERESDLVENRKIALQIFEAIEMLAAHPHFGQRLQDYPQLRHRVVSSFKVIYLVADNENVVEIIRILHQRQDLAEHLD